LAFIFLFVVSGIILDTCLLGATTLSRWRPSLPLKRLTSPLAGLLIPASLALTLCLYGFFEARQIHTETVIINTPKLAAAHSPLRIVQISDVHLGLIIGRARLGRILTAVNQARPDILVSTGDLVDGQLDGMEELAEMLADIRPRYGKYAVTGNHEYYAGISHSLSFTKRAGFTLLQGEAIHLDGLLTLAGVNDRGRHAAELTGPSVEQNLLAPLDQSTFTLLLKHRPEISPDSFGLFDLQLSGHTHKGQIFPFSLLTNLFFVKNAGLLTIDEQCQLYVNRGSGTWGPPIRLLSPPEVTVIELRHDMTSPVPDVKPTLDSATKEK
ncbi:MAG: metallophosphoesterase, partial [Desulfobulbaceae bacterium]|nr:metallophosphoesterase [Desulfobulbaceae bacterium]